MKTFMRVTFLCTCIFGLAVLSAWAAEGQRGTNIGDRYRPGMEIPDTPLGNPPPLLADSTIRLEASSTNPAPGDTITVEVYVDTTVPLTLQTYDVFVECTASGGTTGSIDVVPGSALVDTGRGDWIMTAGSCGFAQPGQNTLCNQSPTPVAQTGAACVPGPISVSAGTYYLGEYSFDVSSDADGTFTLNIILPPDAPTALGGNPFDAQAVDITVGALPPIEIILVASDPNPNPGDTIIVEAYVDTPGAITLQTYDVFVECAATGGTTGSIDVVPGTALVDTGRGDWIMTVGACGFAQPGQNTLCNQSPIPVAQTGAACVPGPITAPAGIHYLGEYQYAISSDASGTFNLDIIVPPDAPTALGGNPFIVQGLVFVFGPPPACVGQPDGTFCEDFDGNDCTGVCLTEVCVDDPRPALTACGDQGDSDCDNPDTCDGAGTCQPNYEPSGTACGDPGDTFCDNPDTCDATGGCLDNNEPNGTPCDDSEFCTLTDECQSGLCEGTGDTCPGQICDEINDLCVDCLVDNDCTDPGLPFCEQTGFVCVECLDSTHCDDSDVCTVDTCDLNVCNHVVDPGCAPQLTLDVDQGCIGTGDEIIVEINMSSSSQFIVGGQFFLQYEPTELMFNSAVPGDPPFSVELYEVVDSGAGTIDYAVTVPFEQPPNPGSQGPITLARLSFTAVAQCTTTAVTWRDNGPTPPFPPTRLSAFAGGDIIPSLIDNTDIQIIDDFPTVNNPTDAGFNADASLALASDTALVRWDPLVGSSTCTLPEQDPMLVLCTGTHATLGNVPIDVDGSNNPIGATFPIGDTLVECTVDAGCGPTSTFVSWTVTINPVYTVLGDVELLPNGFITVVSPLDRGITFESFTDCGAGDPDDQCIELAFTSGIATLDPGDPGYPVVGGTLAGDLEIPAPAQYSCGRSRDELHTLRGVDAMGTTLLSIVLASGDGNYGFDRVVYTVDFTGVNGLLGGNLNDDCVIDVLDFGVLAALIGPSATPTDCTTVPPDADVTGDGFVDTDDLSYIQDFFLTIEADTCCGFACAAARASSGALGLEVGISSMPTRAGDEAADFNRDGFVDRRDIVELLDYLRSIGE